MSIYLDGEIATIDVISQEEVHGIGGIATDLEQFH